MVSTLSILIKAPCLKKTMNLVDRNIRIFRSKEDISAKNLMKYKVLSPCEHTHNMICQKDLIEETHRYDINLVFWTKSFDERNNWMDSNLSISQIEGSKKKKKSHISSQCLLEEKSRCANYFFCVLSG